MYIISVHGIRIEFNFIKFLNTVLIILFALFVDIMAETYFDFDKSHLFLDLYFLLFHLASQENILLDIYLRYQLPNI